MPSRRLAVLLSLASLMHATPALAGWKLVPKGQPAYLSGAVVTPLSDWNQASGRPGKQGRAWTHDGFNLNRLEVFAAVPAGQPLYRERSKTRNPMPEYFYPNSPIFSSAAFGRRISFPISSWMKRDRPRSAARRGWGCAIATP